MVSIFGGYGRGPRGPAGPVGPKGKDGQDGLQLMSQWFPAAIVRPIQLYSEKSCFLLEDLDKDIILKGDVIHKWNDRAISTFNHLGCLIAVIDRGSKDLHKIYDKKYTRYSIGFQNNAYYSVQGLFEIIPGTGFICITFKTNSKEPSYLLSVLPPHDTKFQNFGIMVDIDSICIHGYISKKPIAYEIKTTAKEWTTLFLEYSVKDHEIHFNFMLNADKSQVGSLSLSAPKKNMGCYTVGCRYDNSEENSFLGEIAGLELFHNPSEERFPPDVAMLISKNQKVELPDEQKDQAQTLNNGAKRKKLSLGADD